MLQDLGYTEDYLEDLEENIRWQKEEELLEKLTSAETLEELKEEIEKLNDLVLLAREVEKQEIETKLNRLKEVIEEERLRDTGTKLLIFTESRDTLEYLAEKIGKKWGYTVTTVHGSMGKKLQTIAPHIRWRVRTQEHELVDYYLVITVPDEQFSEAEFISDLWERGENLDGYCTEWMYPDLYMSIDGKMVLKPGIATFVDLAS